MFWRPLVARAVTGDGDKNLTTTDVIFALSAFQSNGPLRVEADGTVQFSSGYNAINAGWTLLSWVVLTSRLMWQGPMTQTVFEVAIRGQSKKSLAGLTALGVVDAASLEVKRRLLQDMLLPPTI